jgi:hypothetical protein
MVCTVLTHITLAIGSLKEAIEEGVSWVWPKRGPRRVFCRQKGCMHLLNGDRRLEVAADYEHTSWGVSLRVRSPRVGKVWVVVSYQDEALAGGSGGLLTDRVMGCGHD